MDYAREKFSTALFEEVLPLLKSHWKEIAHYKDIPLEPDTDVYQFMEDTGGLRIYTLRDKGILVGYAVFFVRSNPHYRSSIQANQDILFLVPQLRKGTNAIKFMRWCEKQLKEESVQILYWHEKLKSPFGELLEREGYQKVDASWSKRLI